MTTDLAPIIDATTVERVLLHGDLKQLTSAQKVSYYQAVCDSVGLNPLTQPFQYLILNGKEILYARREATEQLRQIHQVSIAIVGRELVDDIYVVTARATLPSGRTDENIGAVPLGGLKGEARANNMMKAETKAKRRATLAICGLGMLDETEVASLPPEATTTGNPPFTDSVKSADPRPRELKRQLGVGPDDLIPAPRQEERNRAIHRHDQPEPATVDAREAEAPNTIPPAGFVRVLEVSEPTKTKKGSNKYSVTLSSGEVLTTFSDWMASLAKSYRETGTPVLAATKVTQWGTDLVSFKTEAEVKAEATREPMPTDADIPF